MSDQDTNSVYFPYFVGEQGQSAQHPWPENEPDIYSIHDGEPIVRRDIAEGRAKQQAADRQREAYAVEEMTAVEMLARAKVAFREGNFIKIRNLLGVE
jgi:hypothetical protein